jgi:hypothetical protein
MAIRIPLEDSAPRVAFEDAVRFVFDALGEVPDFRDPTGKQIELRGTLALIVLAMTAGHTRHRKIAKWARLRETALIPLLGLRRAPSYSTIRRVAQGVDATAVRKVLRSAAAMILAEKRRLVTAKDGKVMKAARIEDRRSAHMVSVVEQNTGVIMDADYCKLGEGELTAARRLEATAAAGMAETIAETADALYTNAVDAARSVARGGHYVTKVKKTCASKRARPSPTNVARPTTATVA